MHSSGMRTARLLAVSQHALGMGVSTQEGSAGECLPRRCLPRGCLPRGCLPRGVSAWGCLPRGTAQGGVCPLEVSACMVSAQGVDIPPGPEGDRHL